MPWSEAEAGPVDHARARIWGRGGSSVERNPSISIAAGAGVLRHDQHGSFKFRPFLPPQHYFRGGAMAPAVSKLVLCDTGSARANTDTSKFKVYNATNRNLCYGHELALIINQHTVLL